MIIILTAKHSRLSKPLVGVPKIFSRSGWFYSKRAGAPIFVRVKQILRLNAASKQDYKQTKLQNKSSAKP